MQIYQRWLPSTHEFLFIINNDVLVPDGSLDRLMRTMTDKRASPKVARPYRARGAKTWFRVGTEKLKKLVFSARKTRFRVARAVCV